MVEVGLLACESGWSAMVSLTLKRDKGTYPESKKACIPLLLMSMSLIQSDIVLNIVK